MKNLLLKIVILSSIFVSLLSYKSVEESFKINYLDKNNSEPMEIIGIYYSSSLSFRFIQFAKDDKLMSTYECFKDSRFFTINADEATPKTLNMALLSFGIKNSDSFDIYFNSEREVAFNKYGSSYYISKRGAIDYSVVMEFINNNFIE